MTKGRSVAAWVLSALLTTQFASVMAAPARVAASPETARAMLSAAGKIPPGSRVSVALADGRRLNAIMLAVDDGAVVLQQRTRLPEPPIRIDPAQLVYLELEQSRTGFGKMLAIGAAVGAGVTLAFLAVLAAAVAD